MSDDPEPLVSILLPVRDASKTLEACLRSVVRQTWTRWECDVVDDGSSDGTLEIARRFAARDPRFRVVPSQPRGLVASLNSGLERSRGRYVARMDADDLMHRLRLEEQVRMLQAAPELTAVGCHVRLFPRDRLGAGFRAYEVWLNSIDSPEALRREAFVECPVAHPTLLARREELVRQGYRDRGWPEDYDLVLRWLEDGHAIGVLPKRRLAWRRSALALSATHGSYTVARFTACKAEFLARRFLQATDRYILWGYGGTGRELRRALARHGKHPSRIVELHPGRLGNAIHGAPVIAWTDLRGRPREPLIASVAGIGPRTRIRQALVSLGWVETRDFVCAA